MSATSTETEITPDHLRDQIAGHLSEYARQHPNDEGVTCLRKLARSTLLIPDALLIELAHQIALVDPQACRLATHQHTRDIALHGERYDDAEEYTRALLDVIHTMALNPDAVMEALEAANSVNRQRLN